jgi:hypothetical protein
MQNNHLGSQRLSGTRMISIALCISSIPGILNVYANYYGIKREQVFDDNNDYRKEWRKHARYYKGEASEIKVITQEDYGLEWSCVYIRLQIT